MSNTRRPARSRMLTIRLTDAELLDVENKAAAAGCKSASDFVRSRVLTKDSETYAAALSSLAGVESAIQSARRALSGKE